MDEKDREIIKDHYYLGARKSGVSKALLGNVVAVHVLISDTVSDWSSEEDVEEYKRAILETEKALNRCAEKCGYDLKIRSVCCRIELPTEVGRTSVWWPKAFEAMGFAGVSAAQSYYEKKYDCDEAPIIFALNRRMRSFAMMNNERSRLRLDEYSAVYRGAKDGRFNIKVMIHELLHQFGAVDLYYPQKVEEAASKYFPKSIMLYRNGNEIDELTCYLIGWTDTLTPRAVAFLKETLSLTEEEIFRARINGA